MNIIADCELVITATPHFLFMMRTIMRVGIKEVIPRSEWTIDGLLIVNNCAVVPQRNIFAPSRYDLVMSVTQIRSVLRHNDVIDIPRDIGVRPITESLHAKIRWGAFG